MECIQVSVLNVYRYRTHFRPTYKISYKTVTELEWRCCPGYQGYDCRELKDIKLLQVERLPHAPPSASEHIPVKQGGYIDGHLAQTHVKQNETTEKKPATFIFLFPDLFIFIVAPGQQREGQRNHPWGEEGRFGGHTGHRPVGGHGGYQNAQHLEEEVQRLSQMVLDMQARMTDMSSNLRVDFQEDASKMLVTLLNNMRQPVSATGAKTQTVQVQDFSFERETTPLDDVMTKISKVADDLESKSNTLDELVGRVSRHDGQIHLLMDTAQNHLATPPPAPPASDADLRDYLDQKIHALREELMEGMDIKMADLKNSCDYKILSVQEQCEGQETNYLSLAELMDSKETDLRNEIQDLKTKLLGPGTGDLRVSDSVLARVENLETRLNSSEKTVVAQCLSVEEKLKIEQAEAIKDLRETLEDKLASMEERLSIMLVDTSRISTSDGQSEHQEALQRELNSLKGSVHSLEAQFDVLDQACSKECKPNFTLVTSLQQDIQSCRSAVDAVESRLKTRIDGIRAMEGHHLNTSNESLNDKLSHLKGRVDSLEDSLSDVVHQLGLNSTWGQNKAGAEREAEDLSELHTTLHHELRNRLDELGREVRAEAKRCRGQTEDAGKEIAHMDSRIFQLETLCDKLDPISASLQTIKEGLNKHVTGLWTHVSQLNGTLRAHARDIGGLRETCQNLISNAEGELQVQPDNNPGKKGKL